MIRVIIVEDEPATARGLKLLITKNYVNFEVIAICENGKDGLERILELQPDLVFADIEIPFINGLEMIQQIKEHLDNIKFIILTGYSDFEYARKAIRLGVTEYLLKPITTSSLDNIMSTCYLEQQSAQRALIAEHLQQRLSGESVLPQKSSPLKNCRVNLLFLFWGPIQNNIFNQLLTVSPEFLPPGELLAELEKKHHVSILPLHGRHLNERIYALVYSQTLEINSEEIADALYRSIAAPNTFFNLIVTDTIEGGAGLSESIQEAYLYALFGTPFGYSSMSRLTPVSETLYNVSDTVKHFCSGLSKTPVRSDLQQLIQSIVNYWKQSRVSQYMLTSELHYFFSNVMYHNRGEDISYPDITEIVASSQSYEELCKSLQYELEQIYHFPDTETQLPESSLAETVKNWLDNNFTTQITYKIFPDLFGYNEKYISTVFKKEYGVSPNKYVGKLRLDMAKNLMLCNPDILMKDIAAITGFTDAFYFSRVFKAQEGISPNQFLKNQKKEE